MPHLLQEAFELHGHLSRLYWREIAKNGDRDPLHAARLWALKLRAADRWRRRAGLPPRFPETRRALAREVGQ